MTYSSNKISFTARCPEIRLGQWISHTVNSQFPHYSNSMLYPAFNKHVKIKKFNPESYLKRKKLKKAFSNILDKLSQQRELCSEFAEKPDLFTLTLLNQLKKNKVGNCGEMAMATQVALKLNNIKNAKIMVLATDDLKTLDHTVCAFNRDGSVCNQIENNNTIIVDSWCGMVDFANNMIHNYKNMFQEHFKIPKNKKICFAPVTFQLDVQPIRKKLLELYPELKRPQTK